MTKVPKITEKHGEEGNTESKRKKPGAVSNFLDPRINQVALEENNNKVIRNAGISKEEGKYNSFSCFLFYNTEDNTENCKREKSFKDFFSVEFF